MIAYRNLVLPFLVLSFSFLSSHASDPDTIISLKRNIDQAETDSSKAGHILYLADRYQDFGILDSALKYLEDAGEINKTLRDNGIHIEYLIIKGSALMNLNQVDSAETLLLLALKLSQDHGYRNLEGKSHNMLAQIYDHHSDLMKAKTHFELARDIFIELGDTLYVAGMNQNIAVIYTHLGLIDEALEAYLSSLDIYEARDSKSNIAIILNNISRLYRELGEPETAFEYLHRAIAISKELGDQNVLSMSYINLSTLYSKLNQHQQALDALDLAEANFPDPAPIGRMARVFYNRGLSYMDLEDYRNAEVYCRKCLDISSDNGFIMGITYGNLGLGLVYQRMGLHNKADIYLLKALELGSQIGDIETTITALENLVEVEKAKGNYKQSLDYAEQYYTLKDSLLNEKRTTEIARLKTVYETEKKEKENLLLKKDQEFHQQLVQSQSDTIQRQYTAVIIISLVSILLLIVVVLFFRERIALKGALRKLVDQNLEIREQQSKLQELIATRDKFFSIIAHDLKSPFNALIGFTAMLEDPDFNLDEEKKKELISQLRYSSLNTYELLENLLGWAMSQRGNMEVQSEVIVLRKIVESGMKYLKAKADEKPVSIQNEVDPGLKAFADPKMTESILRNLLSNAIKFSNQGGRITVAARQLDFKTVQLSVSDEGIGISKSDQGNLFRIDKKVSRTGTKDESGTGLGLILCQEFVQLQQGSIIIESEPGVGTTVSFTLPIEE